MTTEVQLKLNETALKRSLRFAFANHDTCVAELLQNSRRAGATQIRVSYSTDDKVFTISDDGCGITDFKALLTIGESGWSADVCATEQPYGLGFLSAIYAAARVEIHSCGKHLAFSTDEALNAAAISVNDAEFKPGTHITLSGFEWASPKDAMTRMARGFPVPISFNEEEIRRPDASSDQFIKTAVGDVLLRSGSLTHNGLRVYLQGFLVYAPHTRDWELADVVHLDSTKFKGKLPDRDRIIEEREMAAQVMTIRRDLYLQRLLDLKKTLPPADFCRQCRGLASSIQRLDVFNDVDALPAEWLARIEQMPHDYWERLDVFGEVVTPAEVTRRQVESGEVQISTLCDYSAGGEEEAGSHRRWFLAHAAGALQLEVDLDPQHWVYTLAQHADDAEGVSLIFVPLNGKKMMIPYARANHIGGYDLVVCEDIRLATGSLSVEIKRPLFDAHSGAILVPSAPGSDRYIGSEVLKQADSYREDDEWLSEICEEEAATVNALLRELLAETDEARLELLLTDALAKYREAYGVSCSIEISCSGHVKVTALSRLVEEPTPAAEISAPAN